MLSDTDRIRNLLGLYCERIDAGDFAGVGELFARGELAAGDLDAPAFVRGAEAIGAFYAKGAKLHDGSPRTKHLVVDTIFEEPAADGTVVVRSSYLVLQAAEGFPLQPLVTGRYVDRFARDDAGAWHFARRHFALDLVGDLSQHWAGPTG
ncbi:nuclear transport factor 2 family protein [Aquihabitans sp. G128]|uniref:nuclear transport factor 2 family protein n=1 Tax=Aquihabitans sp. G128 TaxID=2849779 RepID=UPI001C22D384|nr:nuclear transport factor 2 family protein [Aquihabitans sp. G128]QXC63028.1 nuclear transport factor 2 family protein [Aquihabitans sp. G128]